MDEGDGLIPETHQNWKYIHVITNLSPSTTQLSNPESERTAALGLLNPSGTKTSWSTSR